mgnify:CR=1 FL=1
MVYIISELCGQWGGSLRRAEQMILQSKIGGANAVKVQLWDTYRMPGDNRHLWEYLSIKKEVFLHLQEYAKKLNIDFFASPFHEDTYDWIKESGIKTNKIASSMLEWDFNFCKKMVNDGNLTYVSLGKWNKKEMPFKNDNVKHFHCIAKYPHTFDEAIEKMPIKFSKDTIEGYSDHSLGIYACLEAVRRGATILEKHFTVDKSLQCKTESAHICSMDLDDLIELRNSCDKITISKK